jgi:hypothetical protein
MFDDLRKIATVLCLGYRLPIGLNGNGAMDVSRGSGRRLLPY